MNLFIAKHKTLGTQTVKLKWFISSLGLDVRLVCKLV